MIAGLAKRLFKQTTKPQAVGLVDIYGRPVKDAREYFYPKKVKGIPVFDVPSIITHYRTKVDEIIKRSGIGEHRKGSNGELLVDLLFTQVVERYIEYIHMLPASENHHHSTPGGMIVHSLESSIYALRHAREHKPASTGMQDLDRKCEPIYQYAAWLGGFLHDAGKVLQDILVDAVEIFDGRDNKTITNANRVPSWQPQKESLITWARRFGVATYSVTYLPNRIHNKHNVDSVQLLAPVLGGGEALDFILSAPVNIHSELARVLTGHDTGKDYLSESVRQGDRLSTARDVSRNTNTYLGEQNVSASAKIYRGLQLARPTWVINREHGHMWIIGGEVYLRYSKAFESIVKTATENHYVIPKDVRTVITIMEDTGMIEPYDKLNKTVKFTAGRFTQKDIADVLNGQKVVLWEELIKVKWKGIVFGSDPMPDSAPGLLLLPRENALLEIDENGGSTRHEQNVEVTSESAPDNELPTQAKNDNEAGQSNPPANSSPGKKVAKVAQTKGQVTEIVAAPQQAAPKKKSDNKGINFKNAPVKDEQPEAISESQSSTDNVVIEEHQVKSEVKPTPQSKTDNGIKPNAIPAQTSFPVVSLCELHKKVSKVTVKGNSSWMKIDDILTYLAMEDKTKAIEELKQQNMLTLNDAGKPILEVAMLEGKFTQLISVLPESSQTNKEVTQEKPKAKQAKPGNKAKSNAKAKAPVKAKAPAKNKVDVSSQNGNEEKHESPDYGIHLILQNPKVNSLGELMVYMRENDKANELTETPEGMAFQLITLAYALKDRLGKRIKERDIARVITEAGFGESVIGEGHTLQYVIPYPSLCDIDLTEVIK